ncbi:MAG TPA: hypothetical protein DCE41_21255 [Cytophagales bacterium]|nr:hypothetical protein [Cytophagales bacterium]HAA21479.1 hypothetical protein [Cytophagales bacterium]HAP65216.1 hypothetical protein [Cytophagales bacterium]
MSNEKPSPFWYKKNLLHGISLVVICCPFTFLFFSFFTQFDRIIISGIEYKSSYKVIFITIIFSLILLSLFTLVTDNKWGHKLSFLLTGAFLTFAGTAHVYRILSSKELVLLSANFDNKISFFALSLGILGIINLIFAAKIWFSNNHHHVTKTSFRDYLKSFQHRLRKLELSNYAATILGLISCFLIAVPIIVFIYLIISNILLGVFKDYELKEIIWVGIVGAQGSIVSILFRIRTLHEQSSNPGQKNGYLFLNAFFRPFIGFSLAHVSYFMIKSGFIEITIGNNGEDLNTYLVIAFLTGFTERIGGNSLSSNSTSG